LARDLLKLALLNCLPGGAQAGGDRGPVTIDFAQNHMPTRLRIGDHAVDALDVVELLGQSFRGDGVQRQPTLLEELAHLFTCLLFAGVPLLGEGAGMRPAYDSLEQLLEATRC